MKKWSNLIVVTPTIGAGIFAANDFVGGAITIPDALLTHLRTGRMVSLDILDLSSQSPGLLIYLFKAPLAGTYINNAAESISEADWLNWIGTIEVLAADWKAMANASIVDFDFEKLIKATSGRDIYALIVCTGTPTLTANCLQLTFGVEE